MEDRRTMGDRRSSRLPSASAALWLLLLQAILSAAAWVLAVFDAMSVDACGPAETSQCDYGLAEFASYFAFFAPIALFVIALIVTFLLRELGHRFTWVPIAGSVLVVGGAVLNVWLNAQAFHSVFANPI